MRVGAAPDTFLGGGVQTSLKLIDDGWIGTPVAAAAFVASHSYEHFHPRVEFFYQPGGGPLLDVGPFYLTALVALLPFIELYGTEATLSLPEPDGFGGEPRLRRPRAQELQDSPPRDAAEWNAIPLTPRADTMRGIGVAELAYALRRGTAHRCSVELARHVLEVMLAFENSTREGGRSSARASGRFRSPPASSARNCPSMRRSHQII